eukprot:6163261-Alexandrium_andersonii.AAC.1
MPVQTVVQAVAGLLGRPIARRPVPGAPRSRKWLQAAPQKLSRAGNLCRFALRIRCRRRGGGEVQKARVRRR